MKCVLLFLACSAFGLSCVESVIFLPRHGIPPAGPPHSRAATPVWGTITQKLDHFDTSNSKTWTMRYLYNNQFYKAGGPIFIMLGAEWTIDGGWLQSGQMYDMAKQHGAFMFYTEHRYYGQSYPTSDLSPANLKYLSADLALADAAYFIQYMKRDMPQVANAKVVVFGGSYGGNLAIWMREKYPTLVHAAVSSSAPVFAKVNFNEYNDVVKASLGPSCASVITRAVDTIRQYLQTPAGLAKVQKDYNLCQGTDLTNFYDYNYFFMSISGNIAGQIQYANANTVRNICAKLQDPTIPTDYDRLAKLVASNYCKSNYQSLVNAMVSWDWGRGDSRQWIYQTCTEFGYFQTSPTESSLYRSTIDVNFMHQWCLDFYGPQFTAEVTNNAADRTNAYFGGYNPKVTRVISIHGTVDPWHSIGLSKDLSASAPVIVVQGTSHCADLSSLSLADPPAMQAAKQAVQNYVARWLQEP